MIAFQLFAFRFTFEALDPLYFPPGAAGNSFRGAFGHIFRRIACSVQCPGAKLCDSRLSCAYARLFEPASLGGPSGFADPPRPFVVRAANLDDRSFVRGDALTIDIHIFDASQPALAYFVRAFEELAEAGIGGGRGRIRLVSVSSLGADRMAGQPVFQAGQFQAERSLDGLTIPLVPDGAVRDSVRLRFLTPTELKSGGTIVREAPFHVLMARTRDRISELSRLYGPGELDIDYRNLVDQAREVRTIRSALSWVHHQRTSSRTGQTHPVGGFVGEVDYAGALGPFLPWLRAGYWTGVRRQTVWGKGAFEVE